jgi:hypothetical protein
MRTRGRDAELARNRNKRKKYSQEAMDAAVAAAWKATTALRQGSNNTWVKAMHSHCVRSAGNHGVPETTVRNQFCRMLEAARELNVTGTAEATLPSAQRLAARRLATAHSHFSDLEQRALCAWFVHMSSSFMPPTREELRAQVSIRAQARPRPYTPIQLHREIKGEIETSAVATRVTLFLAYATRRLTFLKAVAWTA